MQLKLPHQMVVEVCQIPQDESRNNLFLFGVSNVESQVVSNLKRVPDIGLKSCSLV